MDFKGTLYDNKLKPPEFLLPGLRNLILLTNPVNHGKLFVIRFCQSLLRYAYAYWFFTENEIFASGKVIGLF
jgi:hypothetical protein